MRKLHIALLVTAAFSLTTGAAFAQSVVSVDGQDYKLVPLKGHHMRVPAETYLVPENATASIAPASNCRLIKFDAGGQYQPQYTTLCGAP